MANINELELNKGQLRTLNAYRKSVGGNEPAAQQMFKIWLSNQPKKSSGPQIDIVAEKLTEVLNKALPNGLRLGNKGYLVKMARGRGVKKGFAVSRNE